MKLDLWLAARLGGPRWSTAAATAAAAADEAEAFVPAFFSVTQRDRESRAWLRGSELGLQGYSVGRCGWVGYMGECEPLIGSDGG